MAGGKRQFLLLKDSWLHKCVLRKVILANSARACYTDAVAKLAAMRMNEGERNTDITTVLFDLDGTLLPMDQDAFTRAYFSLLVQKLAPYGYEKQKLIDGIWQGTAAMVKNDGSRTNAEAFWETFERIFGEKTRADQPLFDAFYREEFQQAAGQCGYNPQAAETVRWLKRAGLRVALATNPIFPACATCSRIRWAGLAPEEFEAYTAYENTSYCKPNPQYYLALAQRLSVAPQHCLMVGNDVQEDMAARFAGMKVFLLTDCLINKQDEEIAAYPSGGFAQLREYIQRGMEL